MFKAFHFTSIEKSKKIFTFLQKLYSNHGVRKVLLINFLAKLNIFWKP